MLKSKLQFTIEFTFLLMCLNLVAPQLEPDIHAVYQETVTTVEGDSTKIPCSVTIPEKKNEDVIIVLWYQSNSGKPIYTYDVRGKPLRKGNHTSEIDAFGHRASFQVNRDSSALFIEDIRKEEEGLFICRVDYRNHPTRFSKVALKIIVPPSTPIITNVRGDRINESSVLYNEGDTLRLLCIVEKGDPPPTLYWKMGDKVIDESFEKYKNGGIMNEIIINQMSRDLNMKYITCEASNNNQKKGVFSLRIRMNVKPLSLQISEKTTILSEGGTYTLKCKSRGSQPHAFITWWDGQNQIEDNVKQTNTNGESLSTLEINPSQEYDNKLIKCKAENSLIPGSTLEDTIRLHVNYKPNAVLRMGSSLDPEKIKVGDDVYFECIITSNPYPSKVSWFHEDKRLYHNQSLGIIQSNQTLVLQKLTRQSRGNYTCEAENTEGIGRSGYINLRVQYAPECRVNQKVLYGLSIGEESLVTCSVDEDPPNGWFKWAFNNSIGIIDIVGDQITNNGSTSSLMYRPQSEFQFGTLLCWSSNEIGQQKLPCVFTIVQAGPPDQVENCTLTNRTADVLEVQCATGFNGGLEQYFLLETFDAETGEKITEQASNISSFAVRNIKDGLDVIINVFAVNEKGKSEAVRLEASMPKSAEKRTDTLAFQYFGSVLTIVICTLSVFIIVVCLVVVTLRVKMKDKSENKELTMTYDPCATSWKSSIQKTYDAKQEIVDRDPDVIPHEVVVSTSEKKNYQRNTEREASYTSYVLTEKAQPFVDTIEKHKTDANEGYTQVTLATSPISSCGSMSQIVRKQIVTGIPNFPDSMESIV